MCWMSVRMTSVSGSYLNCTWNIYWMNVRMISIFGSYLNCIWKLNLNEYQNDIRVWSVSVLYLKTESKWVSEWHPYLKRIWTVSKVEFEWVSGWHLCLQRIWNCIKSWIWMSIIMAFVSGAYLKLYLRSWIWMSSRMASVSGAYLKLYLVLNIVNGSC